MSSSVGRAQDPDGMALPLAVYTWGGATYTLHQWLREQDEARSFRVGNRDDFRAAWGWVRPL